MAYNKPIIHRCEDVLQFTEMVNKFDFGPYGIGQIFIAENNLAYMIVGKVPAGLVNVDDTIATANVELLGAASTVVNTHPPEVKVVIPTLLVDDMTLPQLKTYATENNIDLDGRSNKNKILEFIKGIINGS